VEGKEEDINLSMKDVSWKENGCDESKETSGSSGSVEGSVSRSDANIFILAILYRVLHRLLLLDPLFAKWQVSAQYFLTPSQGEPLTFPPRQPRTAKSTEPSLDKGRGAGSEGPLNGKGPVQVENGAAQGIVLTCINLSTFIQDSLDIVTHVSDMNKSSGSTACLGEGGYIGGARPVQALAENSLSLVLGLLTSSDNGLALLMSITEELDENTEINDPNDTELVSDIVNTDKTQFEDIGIKAKSSNIETWIRNICINNTHNSVRKGVCQVLFNGCANIHYLYVKSIFEDKDQENSYSLSASSGYISEGNLKNSRSQLLNYLCTAITNSAYPRRYISEVLVNKDKDNDNLKAEHLYTLVASLIALRVSPELIYPLREGFDNFIGKENIMTDSEISVLCDDYAALLLNHRSQESFHSLQPDGTLIGILRVLLVLASGKPWVGEK
jgi:hypothetical protein